MKRIKKADKMLCPPFIKMLQQTVVSFVIISFFTFFISSCSFLTNFLKTTITVQEAVQKKEEMDHSQNPSYRFKKLKKMKKMRIRVDNVLVKDIVESSNVDYTFCVIVSISTEKGEVECYVYSGDVEIFPNEDIGTIAELVKGETRVDIKGNFSRFFTLLDDTYTKIEIVNATIDIRDE